MNLRRLSAIFALLCVISGCGDAPSGGSAKKFSGSYPIEIVATTGMVADLAKNVGGDKVVVDTIMGPGVDPHLYKASPGDISKVNRADVVLYTGLHLEGKMAEVFEGVSARKPVFAVAEALDESRLIRPSGVADPHVWFDVSLWLETLTPLAEFLAEYDPANADFYRANAKRYSDELRALHEEVEQTLASVPEKQRVLITAHDAFQYFGRAYGIEVRGIQGISTESEAGVRETNRLVDLIVSRGVRAIFVETSVSQKNVQALIEGARSRGASVRIGGSLYSDAMGGEGTPEGTYPGMVRANVKAIAGALK